MRVSLRDDDVAQDVGDREGQAAAHQREEPQRQAQKHRRRAVTLASEATVGRDGRATAVFRGGLENERDSSAALV